MNKYIIKKFNIFIFITKLIIYINFVFIKIQYKTYSNF